MWSAQEKGVQKIDRLARSLLIQGLPNDIYALIDSNKTAKDLCVENKMHKAFPLPGESSHWQYKFPLPVEGVQRLFERLF
nr:hypothetical protein [Tanacetum cinerariifolium]